MTLRVFSVCISNHLTGKLHGMILRSVAGWKCVFLITARLRTVSGSRLQCREITLFLSLGRVV